MDVSHRLSSTEYYTYAFPEEGPGVGSFVERLNDFGVFGCVTSGVLASGTEPKKAGVLYMETVVEFDEFCPITNDRLEQPEPLPPQAEQFAIFDVTTASNVITSIATEAANSDIVASVASGVLSLLLPDGVWEWASDYLGSSGTSTADTLVAAASGWAISNGSQILNLAGSSITGTGQRPLTLKYLGPSDGTLASGLRMHFKKVRAERTASDAEFVHV
jgi:hypothetical protein